jgi:hypothetical protein
MITAEVLGVTQDFDFESKSVRNYILLRFGDTTVRAEVPAIDELEAVISAGLGSDVPSPAKPVSGVLVPAIPPVEAATLPSAAAPKQEDSTLEPNKQDDPVFEWKKLPDGVLPYRFKLAFSSLSVPERLPASSVDTLMEAIDAEFSESEWEKVLSAADKEADVAVAPPQAAIVPPLPAQPAPQPAPAETLTWADGTPMLPAQGRRARTVPSDDFGNPIVSGAQYRPAVSTSAPYDESADEDGVGQV